MEKIILSAAIFIVVAIIFPLIQDVMFGDSISRRWAEDLWNSTKAKAWKKY